MIHQVFFSGQKKKKKKYNNNHGKKEESATVISFILGKIKAHPGLLLWTENEKKGAGHQYLVSESHDRSVERRPDVLLVGSPVCAEHSEEAQQ